MDYTDWKSEMFDKFFTWSADIYFLKLQKHDNGHGKQEMTSINFSQGQDSMHSAF